MNIIAVVTLENKDKERIFKLEQTGKCPVHFPEFKWLNLCAGSSADGCGQAQKKCWEIIKGERVIPWHCVVDPGFGRYGIQKH